MACAATRRRVRVRIEGTVQGVGFRPYAYRLATELGLAGHVLNDEHGVLLEAEGEPARVHALLDRLARQAPSLAVVERVTADELAPTGAAGFAIVASAGAGPASAPVAADVATCPDCLAELFDPADRRHRYPFVNCTNCGPRFTIVRGIPYDRPQTTMAPFAMCPPCRAEYDDPLDRRFHAQPNACPACGPAVRLHGRRDAADPVAEAAAALRAGAVVAVKGVGGYHLACRADDELAVATLRARKHRDDKPFALMVADRERAGALVVLEAVEERLLTSRERPIVLVPRRPGAPVAAAVAPGSLELGVMLPYSPLHHLLCADAGVPLVMTSGNVSDEPIAFRDEDALERLAPIADLVLLHDREIHTRTDDSVMRAVDLGDGRAPVTLRRSRGYVPRALELPVAAARPVLACGAELKSTFCLASGSRAWVGHHVGDLSNYETLCSYTEGIAHFERLFSVTPEVVAHDLHPDYLSTRYACERDGVELVGVQHHHAHLAACLAEHGETGPAIAAIFDGAGLGTDGAVWGGELLVGDLRTFARAGHLGSVRLPGGDRATRQPWRMACAWLGEALGEPPPFPRALDGRVDAGAWRAVSEIARTGLVSPETTSAGRLFDAVAALCGLRAEVTYEGQAAIELEAACDPAERGAYELPWAHGVLDARPAILAVARDVAAGTPVGVVAARFHHGLADATAAACVGVARERNLDLAVLSGGVFQNRRLLERTAAALARAGLRVLVPQALPANDGGIAFGQAAVAATRGS